VVEREQETVWLAVEQAHPEGWGGGKVGDSPGPLNLRAPSPTHVHISIAVAMSVPAKKKI
jgi:hypothetical protein